MNPRYEETSGRKRGGETKGTEGEPGVGWLSRPVVGAWGNPLLTINLLIERREEREGERRDELIASNYPESHARVFRKNVREEQVEKRAQPAERKDTDSDIERLLLQRGDVVE